ncbi:MAG: CRISPR-associated endonuclease Cas2 [Parcubacteria group bacterium]|nr:CRISPR-associated endonuclease Cas2 [Parcubacteria group bacterium]
MKIKIPLTAKMLLAIYDLVEETGSLLSIFSRRDLYNNFFENMGYFEGKVRRRERRERQFANLVHRLKKDGYLIMPNNRDLKGGTGFFLSKEGLEKIYLLKARYISREKRKDKLWYMVVFDVPEEKRKARDQLRCSLHRLGFKQFQKSIWISPYEIFQSLKKEIDLFKLREYVRIFLIHEKELDDNSTS